MKLNYYTLRDTVAQECGPVFGASTDAVALRMIRKPIEGMEKSIRDDFELLHVFTFDHDTMVVESNGPRPVDLSVLKMALKLNEEDGNASN